MRGAYRVVKTLYRIKNDMKAKFWIQKPMQTSSQRWLAVRWEQHWLVGHTKGHCTLKLCDLLASVHFTQQMIVLQNWSLSPHILMYSHGTWRHWSMGRVTLALKQSWDLFFFNIVTYPFWWLLKTYFSSILWLTTSDNCWRQAKSQLWEISLACRQLSNGRN